MAPSDATALTEVVVAGSSLLPMQPARNRAPESRVNLAKWFISVILLLIDGSRAADLAGRAGAGLSSYSRKYTR